jgi:LysM repeat protein
LASDLVDERVSLLSMTDSGHASPVTTPAVPATAVVCPYLMSSDGRWRSSTPAREHRCTVVAPPAILALEKQRRLCLTSEHLGCSTYLAALAATDQGVEEGVPGSGVDDRRPGRAVTRTAPLVLDHGRLAITLPSLRTDRGAGQGGLVALMAVAFVAIVLARLSDGGPNLTPAQAADGASATPSGITTPAPTLPPRASDVPASNVPAGSAPAPTLVPTEVEPTPAPPQASATAPPSARPATYKVRSGDTLGGIAREFGTTVSVLMELNGIENPRLLRVGQVLELP